jgi:hypothetical protein
MDSLDGDVNSAGYLTRVCYWITPVGEGVGSLFGDDRDAEVRTCV